MTNTVCISPLLWKIYAWILNGITEFPSLEIHTFSFAYGIHLQSSFLVVAPRCSTSRFYSKYLFREQHALLIFEVIHLPHHPVVPLSIEEKLLLTLHVSSFNTLTYNVLPLLCTFQKRRFYIIHEALFSQQLLLVFGYLFLQMYV